MVRGSLVGILAAMLPCAVGTIPIAAAQPSPATSPATKPSTMPEVVTRIYDVADLVTPIQNYPYQSTMVPPTRLPNDSNPPPPPPATKPNAQYVFQPPAVTQRDLDPRGEKVDSLLALIRDTINPGSWRENGGPVGSVRDYQLTLLVVTQTPEAQANVADLLKSLRTARAALAARTVSIHLSWLRLDPGKLTDYLKPHHGDGPPIVNMDAVTSTKGILHYEARITCFSGQTVNLSSGRGQSVVTSLHPVVGQRAALYQIDSALVHTGLIVELTPLLVNDHTATLDLHAILSDVSAPAATQPAPTASVDRVDALAQQLSTTLRLPLNTPVLVGGMTLEPVPGAKDPGQLYLVAEVSP